MKPKTRKAAAKRVNFTGAKKKPRVLRRQAMQDHFNARQKGKKKRSKRRDVKVAKADQRHVKRMNPHR